MYPDHHSIAVRILKMREASLADILFGGKRMQPMRTSSHTQLEAR